MYDCDIIGDMVYLIYKLDDIITTSNANSNVTLSPENIVKIQSVIKSFSVKLNTVKTSLKDSIAMLSSISLEQIDIILLDQLRHNNATPIDMNCVCGFPAKTTKGLVSHQRKCIKQKAP